MKAPAPSLLLLVNLAAADSEEEAFDRRHGLTKRIHPRRLDDASSLPAEVPLPSEATDGSMSIFPSEATDGSMSVRLTRSPNKGSAAATRVKKPAGSGPAGAKDGKSGEKGEEGAPVPVPVAAPETAGSDAGPSESADASDAGSEEGGKEERLSADDPTSSPSYVPTSYVPTYFPTNSGKVRKVDWDNYDDDSVGFRRGKGEKPGKPGGGGGSKGAKAAPERETDMCEKRFDLAWKKNEEIGKKYPDIGKPFGETPQEMKEKCNFDTVDNPPDYPFGPNLACPFIYTPETGFLDTEEEVVDLFIEQRGEELGKDLGEAFWLFQMYCECYNGLNEGCAAAIPDISKNPLSEEAVEYCEFVGIWNADFELEEFDGLSDEVQECGCYFVQKTGEAVDTCPGVDLGAFYV